MRLRNPLANSRSGAFTLVELLVVIGIIAVLIGILLPVLGKARDASYRVKCASNLRQLGVAVVQYAAENKDGCPIGFVSTAGAAPNYDIDPSNMEMWFSYNANWNNGTSTRVTGMALLGTTRLLQGGQAFYCPKEERTRVSYDTKPDSTSSVGNPWPFDSKGNLKSGLTYHSYFGYWCRPMQAFPAVDQSVQAHAASIPAKVEGYYLSGSSKLPKGWMRYSATKNKALIADLARGPIDIKLRHKDGINVYYGNGSVKYVKMTDFEKAGATTSGGGGPFGGGPATTSYPWKTQTWINPDGAGVPGDATGFTTNSLYLTSDPNTKSPGFWNLLDRAP